MQCLVNVSLQLVFGIASSSILLRSIEFKTWTCSSSLPFVVNPSHTNRLYLGACCSYLHLELHRPGMKVGLLVPPLGDIVRPDLPRLIGLFLGNEPLALSLFEFAHSLRIASLFGIPNQILRSGGFIIISGTKSLSRASCSFRSRLKVDSIATRIVWDYPLERGLLKSIAAAYFATQRYQTATKWLLRAAFGRERLAPSPIGWTLSLRSIWIVPGQPFSTRASLLADC